MLFNSYLILYLIFVQLFNSYLFNLCSNLFI